MYEIYEQLRMAGDTVGDMIAFVMVLYGLAECFFGFKLMKIRFAICGFALGLCVSFVVSFYGLNIQDTGVLSLTGLVGAILGAVLLYKIYLIGVFLSNGGLTAGFMILLLGTSKTDIIIAVLFGILVGVLAVKFVRVWVIFCSALAGGIHWLAASPALLFPRTQVFFQLFFSLSTAILSAFAVVVLEKKLHPAIWKGIFFYWVYILSWIPINLLCLVKRTTTWEVIPHTRSLSFSRLNGR